MSDCCDAAFRNVYYSSRKCAWADAVPGVKKEKQFDPDDPFFRVGASHTSMVARTKHNKTRYQMYQEAQRPKKQTTARPVYRIRCEQVPDNSTKRMRARAARKQEKDQRNVFLPDGEIVSRFSQFNSQSRRAELARARTNVTSAGRERAEQRESTKTLARSSSRPPVTRQAW